MPNLETLFIENFNKGKSLFEQGQFDKAVVYLERAYRIKPDDSRLLNMLGMTYFRLNQLDEAVQIYEVLARKNPNIPVLYSNLGLIKMKRGDIDGAEMAFLRVIELQPDNRKVYGYLGLIAERRGEIDLALEYYEKAGARKKVEMLKAKRVEIPKEVEAPAAAAAAGHTADYDEAEVIEARPLHEPAPAYREEPEEVLDESEYTRPMEDILNAPEVTEPSAPAETEQPAESESVRSPFEREDLKDTREYEDIEIDKLLSPLREGEKEAAESRPSRPKSPFDSEEVEATIEEEGPMTIFMPPADTAVEMPEEGATGESESSLSESVQQVWEEGFDTSPGERLEEELEEKKEEAAATETAGEVETSEQDWTVYQSPGMESREWSPDRDSTAVSGEEQSEAEIPSVYIAQDEDSTDPGLVSGPPPYEAPLKETIIEPPPAKAPVEPHESPATPEVPPEVTIVKPPEPDVSEAEKEVRPVNLGLYAREQLYIHPPAGSERFLLLEPYLLEVVLSDRVLFREGAMVAFNGHLIFERFDVTDDFSLIQARGLGILFLSYSRYSIHLISLNEEKIFISLPNFLVAQANLEITPRLITQTNNRIFPYLEISGTGTVGFILRSKPLDIKVMRNLPAVVNSDAIVAWSGSVHVESVEDPQVKSLVRAYNEQALPLRFQGIGDVIVEQGALWGDRRLMTRSRQD